MVIIRLICKFIIDGLDNFMPMTMGMDIDKDSLKSTTPKNISSLPKVTLNMRNNTGEGNSGTSQASSSNSNNNNNVASNNPNTGNMAINNLLNNNIDNEGTNQGSNQGINQNSSSNNPITNPNLDSSSNNTITNRDNISNSNLLNSNGKRKMDTSDIESPEPKRRNMGIHSVLSQDSNQGSTSNSSANINQNSSYSVDQNNSTNIVSTQSAPVLQQSMPLSRMLQSESSSSIQQSMSLSRMLQPGSSSVGNEHVLVHRPATNYDLPRVIQRAPVSVSEVVVDSSNGPVLCRIPGFTAKNAVKICTLLKGNSGNPADYLQGIEYTSELILSERVKADAYKSPIRVASSNNNYTVNQNNEYCSTGRTSKDIINTVSQILEKFSRGRLPTSNRQIIDLSLFGREEQIIIIKIVNHLSKYFYTDIVKNNEIQNTAYLR